MLRLGLHLRETKTPLLLDPRDLLCHSALIGQSGSGKSYLTARLIEEIILRTRARIVVIDPNGDFRRVAEPSSVWQNRGHAEILQFLHTAAVDDSFDDEASFTEQWPLQAIQYLAYKRDPRWEQFEPEQRLSPEPAGAEPHLHQGSIPLTRATPATGRTPSPKVRLAQGVAPLRRPAQPRPRSAFMCVHWRNIPAEQNFLLQLDPIAQPRVYLACEVCKRHLESKDGYEHGYGLRELESMALAFASNRDLRIRTLQGALLSEDDYMSFQGQVAELRSRFTILYDSDMESAEWAPTDLPGYLIKGFRSTSDPWRLCVIELAGAPHGDMLLAADVALSTILREAKIQWQRAVDRRAGADVRVPTFVVIDEAHNFAPSDPSDRLQRRVSERIAEIAAEGRKFGVFCVLATQRPDKLRRGILEECENACLLRIQSKRERSVASAALGIPEEVVDQVASVRSGEGLISGRWVPAASIVRFAPARSVVGGGNLDPTYWAHPDPAQPLTDFFKVFESGAGRNASSRSPEALMKRLKDGLDALYDVSTIRERLASVGISGPVLGELVGQVLPDLRPVDFGFNKLTELLQFACIDKRLCMYANPPFEVALGLRSTPLAGFTPLPDLERRSVHSVESYARIAGTGFPILRPPPARVLSAIASFLEARQPNGETLGGLIERASREIEPPVDYQEVKAALLCLVASSCFDRSPANARLAEQTLSLRDGLGTAVAIRQRVRDAVQEKLRESLGMVEMAVLDEFLEGHSVLAE